MKAICVLEAVLRMKDDEHFSYFGDNNDGVVQCSESPQASLREKAIKAEECNSGIGTSPTSGIDIELYPEQSQVTNGPQMKRRRGNSTNCHQCHKNKENIRQCKKCNKQYCIPCATRWYPTITEAAFIESCPMCRNMCNCGGCLQSKGASKMQDLGINREESFYFLKYTIKILLPSLRKFVAELQGTNLITYHLRGKKKVINGSELLARAEALAGIDESTLEPQCLERFCSCLTSSGWSIDTCKASSRDQDADNYLYCPLSSNTNLSDLHHFQFHFFNGQPVVVRNVVSGDSGLWEPAVLERTLRLRNSLEIYVLNCSNCSQEKVLMGKFFEGYSKGMFDRHGHPKILKLEEWPSSGLFHEQMLRHHTELLEYLPFKHYTHPDASCLNVPAEAKLPEMPILNPGPKLCVHYGPHGDVEGSQWDSITKLQYTLSDRVNILMHATSNTPRERSTLERLGKSTLNGHKDAEAGTLWDVFRKKDVPKLEEYLRKYDQELRHILPQHQIGHPIHDQMFYLTTEHKRKLKDEYGVEPWSFVQKLGDAVIIPAHCLYQYRNLQCGFVLLHVNCVTTPNVRDLKENENGTHTNKSSVHIAVDFVSSECLARNDHESEKLRTITPAHFLEDAKSKAKGLIISAVKEAVEYLEPN